MYPKAASGKVSLLDLPDGEHRLSLQYNPLATPWPRRGWIIGVSSVVLLALTSAFGLRRFDSSSNRISGEVEGLLATSRTLKEWFTTCPNCHFKLAAGEPPNSVTYPFNVIRCSICGYRLDERGFEAGKYQSDDERLAIAGAWIQSQGWSSDSLSEQFGFGPDELFETKSVEHLPAVPPFFSVDIAAPDEHLAQGKTPDEPHDGKAPSSKEEP
jgi:hypothetical protein